MDRLITKLELLKLEKDKGKSIIDNFFLSVYCLLNKFILFAMNACLVM